MNLAIHPGEYVAISGPSGCGKSTLLSILGLLDTPTAGDYTLNGCPVAQLRQADRARTRNREIGFIFQSFNLIGGGLVFGLHGQIRADLREVRDEVRALRVDVQDLGDRVTRLGAAITVPRVAARSCSSRSARRRPKS